MKRPQGEEQLVTAYEVAKELQELSERLTKAAEDAAQALGITITKEGDHA